jgi:multiple sugar transport system substrate-binding protein
MKKAIKILSLMLIVSFVFGTVFVGCGSTNKEPVKADASTKDAAAKKEPITLKFTYWGSPIEKKAVRSL